MYKTKVQRENSKGGCALVSLAHTVFKMKYFPTFVLREFEQYFVGDFWLLLLIVLK